MSLACCQADWPIPIPSLRADLANPVLHLEDIAVKIGDPLSAFHCQGKVVQGISDKWLNSGPEKSGIAFGNIGWRLITKLGVAADLLKLVK